MELKKVVSEETKYVTKKNVDEKILKKNIPSKWKKVGITAAIFSVIMRSKTILAVSEFINIGSVTPTAGVLPVDRTPPIAYVLKNIGYATSIVTAILGIIYFIKMKKDQEKVKVLKDVSVTLLIIAIVSLISGFLIEYFYWN